MPLFDVKNIETDEVTDFYGSFSALQEYLKENPSLRQAFIAYNPGNLDAANYGNVATKLQPTDAFKQRMRHISKTHKMDNSQNYSW